MRPVALLCLLLAGHRLLAQTTVTQQHVWEDIDSLVAVTKAAHYN